MDTGTHELVSLWLLQDASAVVCPRSPACFDSRFLFFVPNSLPPGLLMWASHPGPPSPRWHRTALWVGWIGNVVLVMAVIALGIWVSHLMSEKGRTLASPGSDGAGCRDTATPPGSEGAGSRDTATPPGSADRSMAECSARLERFRSQLCPPAQPGPAGGSGCKLCPTDWQLHGDKCYWVGSGSKTWSESRSDCSARGSQLLVIRDKAELASLQPLTRGTYQFWVGLSRPSPEKAWTWLDGSPLDQTLFRSPLSSPAHPLLPSSL
ncbi:killer cell lectin-like receptor subfamily B member 1B allele C isoform X2 [Caretta caretta]|uniref:killer cell lectin-like receptor subfamily B member 1B allele C isoform X2 n=1 Tax=Caretta caretta TaxID=8467 RepID=UPI003F4BBF8B